MLVPSFRIFGFRGGRANRNLATSNRRKTPTSDLRPMMKLPATGTSTQLREASVLPKTNFTPVEERREHRAAGRCAPRSAGAAPVALPDSPTVPTRAAWSSDCPTATATEARCAYTLVSPPTCSTRTIRPYPPELDTRVTTPGAAATTWSPASSARFQSTALRLGLWLSRVLPVHSCPHGNGIWYGVAGAASAGRPATDTAATTPPMSRERLNGTRIDSHLVRHGRGPLQSHEHQSNTATTETLNRNRTSACLSRVTCV